jgi:hypothetical protein
MPSYTWHCHPDLALSTNSRRSKLHFRSEASRTKDALSDWSNQFVMAEVAVPKEWPIHIAWTCIFANHREAFDASNLSGAFKPAEDALKRNGLIPDDNCQYVRRVTYESIVDAQRAPMTIMKLEKA